MGSYHYDERCCLARPGHHLRDADYHLGFAETTAGVDVTAAVRAGDVIELRGEDLMVRGWNHRVDELRAEIGACSLDDLLRFSLPMAPPRLDYEASHGDGDPSSVLLRSTRRDFTFRRTGIFPSERMHMVMLGARAELPLPFVHVVRLGGRCHLRFDDTNPVKEDTEYVDTIIDSVRWLGFSWEQGGTAHLHYASDYFEQLYQFAELLIQAGKAYVDSQDAETIAATRGNFSEPGTPSPWRGRRVFFSLTTRVR